MRLCVKSQLAVFVFLLATFAHAQNSQFFFDANGNLLVQTAEISAPPQIIGQPQNRVVVPGEAASFFVVAADTRALTYQWRFNNVNIGGATGDAALLQNVSTNNEGEYRVVLTNPSGSVTSAPALLMIDSDGDGLGDSWERTYFTNLNQNATSDFDSDGSPNLNEFLNDTNPTNTISARFRLLVIREGGSVIRTPDQPSYTNGEPVTLTVSASANETFHAWLGDVVTRSNSVTLLMTRDKTLHARFTPIVFTWTNFASGDWNVAANWTPNLVPGSNDTVIITSGVTVTLNTPADCADVTLGGAGSPTLTGSGNLTVRGTLSLKGTISGTGNVTVLGNLSWTSGTMSGGGRTIIAAGATLNAAISGGVFLNGRTLENGGTVLWTGAGSMVMNPTAVITNRAGALFEMQNAVSIVANNGLCRFDNAGTFRKSVNPGTITFPGSVSFNNSGTVEIQTGTLSLGGGTHSGSFTVPAGTALNLADSTHTASGSSSITGSGQLRVSGGFSTLAGLVNVSGSNMFSGGTANFTGNTICTNNTVTISGGTANFSGTGLVSPAVVNLSNGTLGGTSTVTVNSVMNWTSGTMSGSGRTIIPVGATLNAAISGGASLNGRTLENGGTVLWTGAGFLVMNPPAVITNRAGALFEMQNALTITANNGLCRFDNAGTFRKSVNPGTATFPVSFNNSGTVDIRSGILAVSGGYASTPNALLNCALGGTTPGTGYGQLQVAGTVTLNGALSVELINGFLPATNDTFAVLTAGTRNGTFANFNYPSNAVTMQLSNTMNSVIARVTDVLTAIPRPMLLPPELSGANLKLTWTAVSNTAYRLEFNADLTPSNWNALAGDVTATSNTASKFDPLTSSNRVYRVRVLP